MHLKLKGNSSGLGNFFAQFVGRNWSVLWGFSAVKWHVWSDISPRNFLLEMRQTCHFDANIPTNIPFCNITTERGGVILQLFSQNGHP